MPVVVVFLLLLFIFIIFAQYEIQGYICLKEIPYMCMYSFNSKAYKVILKDKR